MTHPSEHNRCISLVAVFVCMACGCANMRSRPSDTVDFPRLTAEELFQVALLQARRGDLFRAEQYLIAARAQGHDDATTTYWLVRVCVSAGRYHSALRHGQERLSRNPGDWRLRFVVASIHEALGEISKAREQYLVLEPTGVHVAEVRAALARLSPLDPSPAEGARDAP